MRKYEYPYYADWFSISLRWLVLLGVAYSLVLAEYNNYILAGAVLVGVLWNFVCMFLAIMNSRFTSHRILNVILDLLVTTVLFLASQGFHSPLLWVGLLNLFSAGIYFGWIGSLVVAFIVSFLQITGSIFVLAMPVLIQQIAVLVGFNLLAGLLFGWLTDRLYQQLRGYYFGQRQKRSETDEKLRMTERRRMQNLFEMVETINVSLDHKIVLQTTLDLSHEVLVGRNVEDEQMCSAILLFEDTHLKIMTARNLQIDELAGTFPARMGALNKTIREGKTLHLENLALDPELNSLRSIEAYQAIILLPLRRGLDTYGLMLFAHREPGYFTGERQEILEMISQHAAIAIQNAQLFQDLEIERNQLQRIQEEERKLLARDLHDGPTQSITGIAMRAEYIRRLLGTRIDKAELMVELEQIESLARKTTQEIRGMLFSLRPLVLETEGLQNALQALAQNMKDIYQQNVSLELEPAVIKRLDVNKQKVIFQIVDEAVNNARKHANASQIQVNLLPLPENPEVGKLEVIDNGVGFDLKLVSGSYESRGSLGMVNLKERAFLINGRFKIDSSPGCGTRVQVAFPLV